MSENVNTAPTRSSRPRRLNKFDDQDLDYFKDFNAKSVRKKIDHFHDAIRCDSLMHQASFKYHPDLWHVQVRSMRYRVRDWHYMVKAIAKELAELDTPNLIKRENLS